MTNVQKKVLTSRSSFLLSTNSLVGSLELPPIHESEELGNFTAALAASSACCRCSCGGEIAGSVAVKTVIFRG